MNPRGIGRARLASVFIGAVVAIAVVGAPAGATGEISVTSQQFVGEALLPTGLMFRGTEVGGLSGLTYDARRGVYYAICDDRSQLDPARFYTLRIDLTDGSLDDGDVQIVDVTRLRDRSGRLFPEGSLDPESIALTSDRTLIVTSEGDTSQLIDPFVREFSLLGLQLSDLPVPAYYDPAPDATSGVRNNLAFESAGLTPDGLLFTGTENALVQDGPQATTTTSSPARLLRYDPAGTVDDEFVYVVEAVPTEPVPPDAFATNGLVDLFPLTSTRLLALERDFSTGVGNGARLYLVDIAGATDVRGLRTLPPDLAGIDVVSKKLLLDLAVLGLTLDNLEGLAFGPVLPDGRQSIVLVSDNNFSTTQVTQFLAFTV